MASWIVKRGLLAYGIPMYVFFVISGWSSKPEQLVPSLVYNIPAWLIAGAIFGVLTWYMFEWQYRRYVAKYGAPLSCATPSAWRKTPESGQSD